MCAVWGRGQHLRRLLVVGELALSGELRVMTRALSYARAEELQPLLTATVLSQRGSIQTDPRTNTVIITDTGTNIRRMQRLVNAIDVERGAFEHLCDFVERSRCALLALSSEFAGAIRSLGAELRCLFLELLRRVALRLGEIVCRLEIDRGGAGIACGGLQLGVRFEADLLAASGVVVLVSHFGPFPLLVQRTKAVGAGSILCVARGRASG